MTIISNIYQSSLKGLEKGKIDTLTLEMDQLAKELYQSSFDLPSSPNEMQAVEHSFGALQPDGISMPDNTIEAASQYYFFPYETSRIINIHGTPGLNGLWDVEQIRRDFPALNQKVHGKPLIWFDSAATSQKPSSVISALSHYYEFDNANVHRSGHTLGRRATEDYEGTRKKVQSFIGAGSPEEIIFLRSTTEAINLVAQAYGREHVGAGDEIIITTLEHHSNIVPWQLLCKEKGACLRVVPINENGEVLLEEYEKLINHRTRIVALSHASNAFGTILPVQEMTKMARRCPSCVVLVDGAQSTPHFPVNVQDIDADFYAFSGHKLFGPTGVGVLYGKKHLLEAMPPWQGGGSMIKTVTFDDVTFNDLPYKFEAGTNNIAGVIGLGAAIDYLNHIGYANAIQHETNLLEYATRQLMMIPGLQIFGTALHKVGVISFILKSLDPADVSAKLDREGIAVRGGHHCAQPALRHFGLDSTVRVSFTFFNTLQEIDVLIAALRKMV